MANGRQYVSRSKLQPQAATSKSSIEAKVLRRGDPAGRLQYSTNSRVPRDRRGFPFWKRVRKSAAVLSLRSDLPKGRIGRTLLALADASSPHEQSVNIFLGKIGLRATLLSTAKIELDELSTTAGQSEGGRRGARVCLQVFENARVGKGNEWKCKEFGLFHKHLLCFGRGPRAVLQICEQGRRAAPAAGASRICQGTGSACGLGCVNAVAAVLLVAFAGARGLL